MAKKALHPTTYEDYSVFLREVCGLITSSRRFLVDAHGHLDRECTLDRKYYAHVNVDPWDAATRYSLQAKRDLVGYLHTGSAYQDEEDLIARMRGQLLRRVQFGTGRFDTCIDTTPDIGLTAFEAALALKEEVKTQGLDLRLGAYPLWGFKRPREESDRRDLFYEASEKADFLCGLPERDDAPNRVGFKGHIRTVLQRAIELKKPAHFHVDQGHDPEEKGTETLIEAVSFLGSPEVPDSQKTNPKEPTVWAVHSISPAAYPEDRFWELVEGLREHNIGVICCPRAAISMRQKRCIFVPTHNSIARILEMLLADIWVRLGSDNVSDVFVPTGTGDLRREIEIGADASRFYSPPVWFRLGVGDPLNETDRELVRLALAEHYSVLHDIAKEQQRRIEDRLPTWTLPRY